MLISTMAFSLMHVCVKYLKHIPFFELIFFRSIISLVLSYAYIKKAGLKTFGHNKPLLITRGIVGTIALSLFFISIQYLPLASAATIGYLSPMFTAIFAVFFLKEKLKVIQGFLFIVAFSGIVLIKGFDNDIELTYVLLGVAASMFAGIAYNLVRKLKDTDHPVVVVFYFPLVATPIMLIWSLLNWVQPVGLEWLLLLGIGVLTQIGQVYLSKALHLEYAGKMTSIKFLGTINALIFGIFLFNETYSLVNYLGIILVIIGVVLNLYFSEKNKAPTISNQ